MQSVHRHMTNRYRFQFQATPLSSPQYDSPPPALAPRERMTIVFVHQPLKLEM